MPRRENNATPTVVSRTLYHDGGAITLDSPQWYAWLADNGSFFAELPEGTLTARKERRTGRKVEHWYAYRRAPKVSNRAGRLFSLYLGTWEQLTYQRLCAAA